MRLLSCMNRKLLRDLAHYRGQAAAIALVVACGVAQFLTNRVSYDAIRNTQASYYGESRFADVFASLKRAPVHLAARIAAIPGVLMAEPRTVMDVTVDVPGLGEPARGRIISVPDEGQSQLNRLYIRRGRYITAGRDDEILTSEAFAEANHLETGTVLPAIINGRWRRLQIVGIALSPEYVYAIAPGGLLPDNRRFGVFWMSHDAVSAAFDMKGAFNDIVLRLERGAGEKSVIASVDRLLEPYGGLGAYGRSDQVSHRFVSDEIAQNRVFGIVIAAVFMGIAAFLVSTLVTRVVSMEREQIGALKAFGFSTRTVSLHYVKFSMIIILAGSVVGIVVGVWYAGLIADAYRHFYRFPHFTFVVSPAALFLVMSVAFGTGILGAVAAAFKAARLKPAEAMRPEAPAGFHAGLAERLGLRRLPLTARIVIRNLERRPLKALLSIAGVASGLALLLVGHMFQDALFYIVEVQFRHVQHDHATIVFNNPRSAAVSNDIKALPGVLRTEPFRLVAARLRHQHHSRRVGLMGLRPDSELRRLVAKDLSLRPIPEKGLVLSTKLAEVLHVRAGDLVIVEPLEGKRIPETLAVAGLVDELLGMSAYLNIDQLNGIMREGRTVSGTFVLVDAADSRRLYSELKRTPAVVSVVSKDSMIESFNQTLAHNSMIGTVILITFASIIAFAAVYTSGRIALSERGRELASLRVLGFTRPEVTRMLVGEQALLVAAAIPLGLLFGYQIVLTLSRIYSWELFRIPVIITRSSYAVSILSIAASAAVSALIVRYRMRRMNLVSVIKTRE